MLTSAEIFSSYMQTGQRKAEMSVFRMLLLGFYAGMFIALAGVGATCAAVSVSAPSLAKLVSALVFPAGLAMVVLCGAELFTGNSLMVIPLLSRRIRLSGMLKNWLFVYLGNFAGSVFVAFMAVYSHTFSLFDGALAQSAVSAAAAKAQLGFGDAFLRGVLCNVLVCIAVWSSMVAKSAGGKLAALYLPIMLFVLCGFEHSIANMYYIPAGIFAAAEYGIEFAGLGWSGLAANLVPVTLGNLVGGGLIVGCGFWLALRDRRRDF